MKVNVMLAAWLSFKYLDGNTPDVKEGTPLFSRTLSLEITSLLPREKFNTYQFRLHFRFLSFPGSFQPH